MPTTTLAQAVEAFESGRLADAETLCRQILVAQPTHAQAMHLLGALALRTGQRQYAENLFRQAVVLEPTTSEFYTSLGEACRALGKLDEAVAAHRQAIQLRPDRAEAYRQLGRALSDQGRADDAIAQFCKSIELRPSHVAAYDNLATTLAQTGRLEEALTIYRQAIALQPNHVGVLNNMGNVLKDLGQLEEALAAYQRAIALQPNLACAYYSMGNVLGDLGRVDDALAAYQRAVAIDPNAAWVYYNMGNALSDTGRLDEGLAAYRTALKISPDLVAAASNLVYTLHFHPAYDAAAILQAHLRWREQYADPLKPLIQPHTNDRSPDRRLKIGYVSPDLRNHVIGRFLLPLLAHHDHSQFEVYCYSNLRLPPDQMTQRLGAHADQWRSITHLSDDQAAQLIRDDGIDILVDLSMHMRDNRLLLFARKPAPVQVTYLAYCSTTGLDTINYRLTDPYLDPPGQTEQFYSEQSIHLPQTYWCYQPAIDAADVSPLPALSKGYITFACLNSFGKVSPPALAAWGRLLQAVPHSRLLLHAQEGRHRQRVKDLLAQQGIDPQRLSFVGWQPLAEYFQLHHQIDIALDSFPYAGGTTTCDALWMGVPVVTLSGQTAVGRGGVSILSNLGLPELIAHNTEQYITLAVELAKDLPRLTELRSNLRRRMEQSPLMDAAGFTRNMEAAYRRMWKMASGRL